MVLFSIIVVLLVVVLFEIIMVASYWGIVLIWVDSLSAIQLCLYSPTGTHSYSRLISAIKNLCAAIGEV